MIRAALTGQLPATSGPMMADHADTAGLDGGG